MLASVLAVLFLTLFSSSVIAARSGSVTERSVHKSKVGGDPLQQRDFVTIPISAIHHVVQTSVTTCGRELCSCAPGEHYSQFSGAFKYGFEVQADPKSTVAM